MDKELDFTARYSVRGYPGIAFRIDRYVTEILDNEFVLTCSHEDMCCGFWTDGDEIVNKDQVIAIMVGDDHEHVVDTSDLVKLEDPDYCRECGQIGCGWC